MTTRRRPHGSIVVGHCPDPDDAFMFHALAHDKIDTGDLQFRHELQDIETLNRRALRGELEVTAVSIHAYAHLLDKYALLPSGCSMGDRYGPMVVARRPMTVERPASTARIAVPGTLTTAFLDAAAAAAARASPTRWCRSTRSSTPWPRASSTPASSSTRGS